jgi:tetratricopeptide (TPR) repeat protein
MRARRGVRWLVAALLCLAEALGLADAKRRRNPWGKDRKKGSKSTKAHEEWRRDETARSLGNGCPVAEEGSTLEALLSTARSTRTRGKQEDRQAALACAHRARYLYPDAPDAWDMTATLLQESGKLDDAASAFESALRLKPSEPRYLHQLGGTFLMMGGHRAKDAIVHLQAAQRQQPSSPAIASDFALANYYTGQAEEAIRLWKRCTELDPGGALQYYYNMVGVNQERSEWGLAQKLLKKMLKLDPLSSETYESLGVVQSTRNVYPAAEEAFRKSLELIERRQHSTEADRVRLLQALADSHMNQEQFAEAIPSYQQALALTAQLQRQGLASQSLVKQLSAVSHLFYCALKCCAWESHAALKAEIERKWRKVSRQGTSADESEVPIEPYAAAFFDVAPEMLRDLAARRSRAMRASLRGLDIGMRPPPHPGFHSPRLVVGYVSADLKTHSVGRLMQTVPQLHDRRRFGVCVCVCVRLCVFVCVCVCV